MKENTETAAVKKSKAGGENAQSKSKKKPSSTPPVVSEAVVSPAVPDIEEDVAMDDAQPLPEEIKANIEIDPNGVAISRSGDVEEFGRRKGDTQLKQLLDDASALIKDGTFPFKPQIFINGKIIEPIGTHTPTDQFRPFRDSALVDSNLYIPMHTPDIVRGKQFNIYKTTVNGQTLTIIADADSTLAINAMLDRDDIYGSPPVPKGGVVLLINTRSVDDTFIGSVSLVNVNSENNIYNQSFVTTLPGPDGQLPNVVAPWEKQEKELGGRLSILSSEMKDSRVKNTSLKSAKLFETDITDSYVKGHSFIAESSSVLKCMINATGAVSLCHAHLESVALHDKADVLIHSGNLKDLYLSGKGEIYHTNKFDFTMIQIPGRHDVRLIRESKTQLSLYDPSSGKSFPINLTDGEYEVQKTVAGLMRVKDDNIYNQDDFTASIMRYITSAITSRLKIIATLAAATITTTYLNNQYKRYRSVFD